MTKKLIKKCFKGLKSVKKNLNVFIDITILFKIRIEK